MRKISFLIILCIAGITQRTNAQQQVSKSEARNAAVNTLRNKTEILKVSSNENIKTVNSLSNTNGDTIMYEVVFENGAAVLLSGSKTCLPVLGYYAKEDNGAVFDPNNDNVSCGLKALLKDYSDEIEWCFAQDTIGLYHEKQWQELQQFTRGGAPSFVHVDTLLTTKWGQSLSNSGSDCPAYNYYVTKTHNNCGCSSTKRCPVGCTGVAMGQIMKYWNYPVYLPNKVEQYDWCNMSNKLEVYRPPYYDLNPDYEKQRDAVARLLKDCADAANAVYCVFGTCATSATAIAARSALVNDFGYSSNAVFRLRSSHPINHNNVWINYLITNLNAGRPVLYGSLGSLKDAHYWVCDGYGDDGNSSYSHEDVKFHFNFGWRGTDDGWYTVSGLSGVGHYNISQEAVFDIYPANTQDYCDFTYPLPFHYTYWCDISGFPVSFAHLCIPKTFTVLESVPVGNGFPTSWHTIASGQVAEYVAHEEIVLLPGFTAEAGSDFVARIEPCANCNSAKVTVRSLKNGEEVAEELYIAVGDNEEKQSSLGKESEIIADDPRVYPNPTTGLLTVDAQNNNSRIQMIELYNAQGSGQFAFSGNGDCFQEIDISHLPSQVYVLKIQMDGQVFTKKLILQK